MRVIVNSARMELDPERAAVVANGVNGGRVHEHQRCTHAISFRAGRKKNQTELLGKLGAGFALELMLGFGGLLLGTFFVRSCDCSECGQNILKNRVLDGSLFRSAFVSPPTVIIPLGLLMKIWYLFQNHFLALSPIL